ncbi:MAG TPA: 50S ribosomal protein L23 [Candidatus Paceibacterota bacterium]|nr:50S ribosomal protein L23 [Candidatus Paceibacterota bacterium]
MALFSKDEETKGEAIAEQAPQVAPKAAHALTRARITEKATELAMKNTFVFDVSLSANKRQVIEAMQALYKVTPVAVRMVRVPRKTVRHARRGTYGTTNLGKKAYVTLKDGDTISLM